MKDFIKWLGVNEKVAKVVVWLLIIMITLIIFNTAMESLGFPYYAITYDNLVKINGNVVLHYLLGYLMTFLNFYAMALLVFRVKDTKRILKYAVLFLILDAALAWIVPNIIMQLFIIIYMIIFCYLFSNKKKLYILYGWLANITTAIIQYIWYMTKAQFIDYSKLDNLTKSILSLDYFIIMAVIILVKEIYLKKRSENNARTTNLLPMDRGIQKRKQVRKESCQENLKRNQIKVKKE